MLNTLIIALALMSSPKADIAAAYYIRLPYENLLPYEKYLRTTKDADPNGWKFSLDEWDALLHRRPVIPEQYTHPERGSNGGIDWA